MPAKSKAQQAIMGMALAYKRGETTDASTEVKELADSMSLKDLEDFASTKTKNLPDKVMDSIEFTKTYDIQRMSTDADDIGKSRQNESRIMKFEEFMLNESRKQNSLNEWEETYKNTSDVMKHAKLIRNRLSRDGDTGGNMKSYIREVASQVLQIVGKKDFINNKPTPIYSELSNTIEGYLLWDVDDDVLERTIKKLLKK